MTPEELRSLADEAQNYFSWEELWADASLARSDAQLFFIAPDLARLCAELGEALQACLQTGVDEDEVKWIAVDPRGVKPAQVALAKLSELNNRAEASPTPERT